MTKKDKSKVRFVVYLEKDQKNYLEAMSRMTKAPVAEIIRTAVTAFMPVEKAAGAEHWLKAARGGMTQTALETDSKTAVEMNGKGITGPKGRKKSISK